MYYGKLRKQTLQREKKLPNTVYSINERSVPSSAPTLFVGLSHGASSHQGPLKVYSPLRVPSVHFTMYTHSHTQRDHQQSSLAGNRHPIINSLTSPPYFLVVRHTTIHTFCHNSSASPSNSPVSNKIQSPEKKTLTVSTVQFQQTSSNNDWHKLECFLCDGEGDADFLKVNVCKHGYWLYILQFFHIKIINPYHSKRICSSESNL